VRPLVIADFFGRANAMRSEFDARVGPERAAPPHRFVWDYWHVPGQYSYIRTFARRFFSPALYRDFAAALRAWGDASLGCGSFTEPWLSYYVDGCVQELHADIAQGAWAFVFSLTHSEERRFTGGETILLGDTALNYWQQFDSATPIERDRLVDRIPPRFNQLLVFDGRVPHGVARVDGTRDPLHSRVAVHGWFLEPSLRAEGALSAREADAPARALVEAWQRARGHHGRMNGLTPIRVWVDCRGTVERAEALRSTLVSLDGAKEAPSAAVRLALELAGQWHFPEVAGETRLTIPFIANDR
jgi:hypothetical protein